MRVGSSAFPDAVGRWAELEDPCTYYASPFSDMQLSDIIALEKY